MKQILYAISIVLLAILSYSCSFNAVKGNGVIETKEINISDYKEIKFSGGSTLVYEQKTDVPAYLRIELDENLFPLLEVSSDNGQLKIGKTQNISPTTYNIYTNSSELQKLAASGSIKAHLKGNIKTSDLKISISGSGKVTIDSLESHSLVADISGSGNFDITGKTSILDTSISGSGKINTINLQADTVLCNVSGSGNYKVVVEKYLKVRISGSGEVRYKGDPQIEQSISGSGKVIKEN